MRILIGGGTGFIGKHLKSLLTERGHEVINISRRAAPGAMTWDEIRSSGFPSNTEGIVNLAGENVMGFSLRFDDKFKNDLRTSRIDSTKFLARVIEESPTPPTVFVCASAIGYYRASLDQEYTEDSPPGDDFMSQLCQDWETAARLPDTVPCRSVQIRIGLACGRDGGMIESMFYPFWMGVGGHIGSGEQWFPWVHVDDVAGIFAHALESDHVTGVLNAVAPQTSRNTDFTRAFADALHRPAVITMPGFVLKAVLGQERADMMLQGQKVIPKRTVESGYRFKYPTLSQACREFAHF